MFGAPAPRLVLVLRAKADVPKRCSQCGAIVEAVPWLDRYQRMTTRLAEEIGRLAQVLPIKQVAAWFGVGWDTVKQINQRVLAGRLGAAADHLDGIRRIAIDEFAIRRGHQYATVVFELDRKRVVWIARGRDQEALRGFLTALGPTRCVINGARWLLLRNKANLKTRGQRVRLRDLLCANRALRSRIPALRTFTAMLERHLDGILSHCRYPIKSGVLEGCNNKIKVLKRVAYGYRDDAYFFLKIRAAFPGIPG